MAKANKAKHIFSWADALAIIFFLNRVVSPEKLRKNEKSFSLGCSWSVTLHFPGAAVFPSPTHSSGRPQSGRMVGWMNPQMWVSYIGQAFLKNHTYIKKYFIIFLMHCHFITYKLIKFSTKNSTLDSGFLFLQ